MCLIGETKFYDGQGESVREAWDEAESWYGRVTETDNHLLQLFEHLKLEHAIDTISANLGFMFKQHKAAEEMGEFSL